MTTLSRATAKALHKSHTSFKVVSDMVRRAVDKDNPSLVKSLSKNRSKMDDCFVDLCYCHDCYKSDTLSNEGITEEVFNSIENGLPKYQYNDGWLDNLKMSYYDLIEASDDKLESIDKANISLEEKSINDEKNVQRQDSRALSSLLSQVELTTSSISTSIDNMYVEVSKLVDGGEIPAKISSMQFTVQKIDDKVDIAFNNLVNQILELLPENEVHERESLRKQFIIKE